MMEPNISYPEHLKIEIRKLEMEKLLLELKTLNRPWFKNPTYLSILLPALLAIASLGYAISTGFFDKKFEIYKLEKASLELDIKSFEQEKNKLISEKDSAVSDKHELKIQVENLKIQIATLNKLITEYPNDIKVEYDNRGNLIETSTGDHITHYNYNKSNQLSSITHNDSLEKGFTFMYDHLYKLIGIIYPSGKMISYSYDSLGNRISETTTKQK